MKKNYIDSDELKEELHKFSLSYKKEVKELYEEKLKNIKDDEVEEFCKNELLVENKRNRKNLKLGKEIKEIELDSFYDLKKQDYKDKLYKEAYKEANGVISDRLGEMFLMLANNLSCKKNWIGYTYREDMIGKGVYFLCKYAHNFDKNNKKANAFAYVTQICKNGFIQVWEKEEGQSSLKDKLIKDSMEKPELDKWLEEDLF